MGLSQMLHFCDISIPLICHVQRQASGNILIRVVFKELEHCVVLLLVFIYLLSYGARGKNFVAFSRHWTVATLLFYCTKYILWLPREIKFPTNSLPAVFIGLEESKLTSGIWAFRSMLFITIFVMEKQLQPSFGTELPPECIHAQNIPLTHGASFSWDIPVRIPKIRAW